MSVFGASIEEILKELENMFEKDDLCERIVTEMQKTVLMDIETIIRKVLSGLVKSGKFMITTALSKGLTNYLMVPQFGYTI